MLLTCSNFFHIFLRPSHIGSRHTIKVFWSVFVYSIYFIADLSMSAYKKFMIFSINHFSAKAHRIKWTRHRLLQVKSDIFFTTFISFDSFFHSAIRMKKIRFLMQRSFAFYYFKYARYQHQKTSGAVLVELKLTVLMALREEKSTWQAFQLVSVYIKQIFFHPRRIKFTLI